MRFQLPKTPYFDRMRGYMPLSSLSGYAQAERRAGEVGVNLASTLLTPMIGRLEYSPYGAALVERIREDSQRANDLTGRWDRAAIFSPATAILGLGAAGMMEHEVIRAEAADAIMQGKAKYFLWTAGVSATPLCIRTYLERKQLEALSKLEGRRRADQARIWRAEKFAEIVKAVACNFGFINVEDAQGSDLSIIFGALECLFGECAIWSDDKQGTGTINAGADLAWAELTGRKLSEIRAVIFGAGAGAMGVYDELVNHGVRPENMLVTDSGPNKDRTGKPYTLDEGRADVDGDFFKEKMRKGIPPGTVVEEFADGADLVINLGVVETLTADLAWTERLTRRLTRDPFFIPMTNPEPGVTPEMLRRVRPDAYYGSGNQVHQNPVNNFTAFGYIGAGALMARAAGIGPMMTVAAACGILEVAKMHPQFGRDHLVPAPDDIMLIKHEAGAVARAAAREGLSTLLGPHATAAQIAAFDVELDRKIRFREDSVREMRSEIEEKGRRFYMMRYPERYAPFSIIPGTPSVYDVVPETDKEAFETFARSMGVNEERWAYLLENNGKLNPKALTIVLEKLRPAEKDPLVEIDRKELKIICDIVLINPALGLALAIRRTRLRPENRNKANGLSIFSRPGVLQTILAEIPEAREAIDTLRSECERALAAA